MTNNVCRKTMTIFIDNDMTTKKNLTPLTNKQTKKLPSSSNPTVKLKFYLRKSFKACCARCSLYFYHTQFADRGKHTHTGAVSCKPDYTRRCIE